MKETHGVSTQNVTVLKSIGECLGDRERDCLVPVGNYWEVLFVAS